MQHPTLDEALDLAEQLTPEDQTELLSILSRRAAERGRERLIGQVREAELEYEAGLCRPVSPEELLNEARS